MRYAPLTTPIYLSGIPSATEYGLYVVDEANIESHGLWESGYYIGERPEWQKDIVERNVNMVARDKNHPCIIYWYDGE